jgi:putative ABC transport system permease protein
MSTGSRGFTWVLKALLSHYWRHYWQTIFLLVGLVAGVGLWSAVQIINQHAEKSYSEARSMLGADASYWIRSRSELGVAQQFYIELRRAGFRQVYPLIEAEVSTQQGIPLSIIATDLFALPGNWLETGGIDIGTDQAVDWLKFAQSPYQSWIPEQIARELGLEQGDELMLRDGRKLPPALVQSRTQQGRKILMDIGAALSLTGAVNFSYLGVAQISLTRLNELKLLLPAELELVENQQHLDLAQLTESLHTHLTAMSLLSFAVGLFIVFNAVRFSLWYRRETFLNLRLMGVGLSVLISVILVETLAWSIIGTAGGLFLGTQLGQFLLPGLSASLHSLYGATLSAIINLEPVTLIQAWLITLGGLLWALAWPLYRQLQDNFLTEDSSVKFRRAEVAGNRHLIQSAIGLLLIAAVLYPYLDSANVGFVVLGLLLFGAAWLLPGLLTLGIGMVTRLTPGNSLLVRWMVSDGWSQLPAMRTAMMALLLAMTANLGVGTLIDSFRTAFVDWLEVRQSADIYVRGSHIDYRKLLDSENSSQWLLDSHARIGVTTRWQGRPTLLRGADTGAPDSLVFPLAQWLGDSPNDALRSWRNETNTILANEQAHYLGGLQLGDQVQLESESGSREYRVVGFFYDYGNPYFQFYLPYDEIRSQWQHVYSRGLALWLKPDSGNGQDSRQLALQALKEANANPGDWISQGEIRNLSINIFNRTFAITSAMNALTLIVAAIALLASLLAILQERLPQFAQWRALGVRRSEQLLVIACPLLIFVGIAWIVAIPLGALLSWILIHKLNIVSFGWSMPMLWEMTPAWQLGFMVLIIVGFTLGVAMLQLQRRLPEALARLGVAT